MKKQKKQFIMILILLILCVAAYIGLRVYNQRQEDKKTADAEAEKIVVTDIESDDVTGLSYLKDGQKLSFVKEDDTWYYEADKSIPIDQDKIGDLVTDVCSVQAADQVTDYDSLADYGLDEPANTITIQTKSETIQLNMGNENSMLSQYYLTKDGDDTVYLTDVQVDAAFDKSVEDLTKEADTETETQPEEAATE